jgi:hypothetical protein
MTRFAPTPLPALALVVALALAGCSQDGGPGGDSQDLTSSAASSSSEAPLLLDPAPLGVTVDPPAPTQAETATLTGSVNQAARVSIDGGPGTDVEAGRWTLVSQPLDFGRTPAVVRVEDGVHSVTADVVLVRLAPMTVQVTYTMAVPAHPPSEHTLWMDLDAFSSAPLYEGKARPHPGFANVHDAMATWSAQTGTPVEYSYHESFDFGVNKIDGVGQPLDASAPPYWGYEVNGETADLGITLQPLAPGDVVSWEYATGA